MRAPTAVVLALLLAACGSESTSGSDGGSGGGGGGGGSGGSGGSGGAGGGGGGSGGSGGAGGSVAGCEPSLDGDVLRLSVGARLAPGEEPTLCRRWTAPADVDVSAFVGELGGLGHHALLISYSSPTAPDGVAPCTEAELMDSQTTGAFQLLAGVSYESSGVPVTFPSAPVQVGLHVPAGAQLVWSVHFLNASDEPADACVTIDLDRGAPVVARLQFRTVLPPEQFGLVIPAGETVQRTYGEPVGGRFRVAAASSHMHEGGTAFRLSVPETGTVLYETTDWAEPAPALFDRQRIVVEPEHTFQLDCTFVNPTATDQRFPDQMCVGGMYLLPCSLPGAC